MVRSEEEEERRIRVGRTGRLREMLPLMSKKSLVCSRSLCVSVYETLRLYRYCLDLILQQHSKETLDFNLEVLVRHLSE